MSTAGHTTQFYLKSSAGSVSGSDEVDGVMKVSLSGSAEQLETTDFKDTSAFRTFISGLRGAEFKVDGQVEPTDAPQNLIRSAWLAGTTIYATFLRTPAGTTGNKGFTAAVNVESYEEAPEVNNVVPFSAGLRVTGAVAVDA